MTDTLQCDPGALILPNSWEGRLPHTLVETQTVNVCGRYTPQDMSYGLVTLSACETGRANVAASDKLIGLGRGCLYAGALTVSMWQVPDISTLYFMERSYGALSKGASKGSALRQSQIFMLTEESWLHPAFRGAFQLIGNDRPLSVPLGNI